MKRHIFFSWCYIDILLDSSYLSTTVKETQKQRKEAKVLKQLEKQKREEAADKEKLELRQNKNQKGKMLF